ncbi:MAG: Trk system potassium transporter TrkA [Alphaproteobacteria bacterium]
MRVIVCGAGQVGSSIALYLAKEGNDLTVIDTDVSLVNQLSEQIDLRAIVGHASHPDVLQQAGADEADMLIAVTSSDEVNMVACQVCHSIFNIPTKIARIRSPAYRDEVHADIFTRDHMPIDVIISPEAAVAEAILRRLRMPGAFDMIPLADEKVKLVGVTCEEGCPIINTPLRQLTSLFPTLSIEIVGIIRNDRAFVPTSDEQMLVGDQVYFVADSTHLHRAMAAFGHEEVEARRLLLLGGGNIGLNIATRLEQDFTGVSVKLIEAYRTRAEEIAEILEDTTVLHGDALEAEMLNEANISEVETVIAVTNDDESNVLASLQAKRLGAKRTITLINKPAYIPLVSSLGVDAVVNPRASTVSMILQHVRRGRIRAVHSLREGFAEVIEAEALETSPIVDKPLSEMRLDRGIIIGAIVRGDEVIIPRPSTIVKPNDRVIIMSETRDVKKVEELFSVRLEFF